MSVDGAMVGAIGSGLCIFVGAGPDDTEATARHLAGRVATLRIHADAAGRMNLDLLSTGGEALVVSQFTLYGDTSRGHRPSFIGAGDPEAAARLCAVFAEELRARGVSVAEGRFGARMALSVENDGPVTLVLSSGERPWAADAG